MVTHDVDEALLLSDRVVMMTNGPEAEIGQILNVPFARPRQRLEVIEHPDYYHLRGELIGFLHQQRRLRQHRSSVAAAASVVAASSIVAAAGVDRLESGANSLPPARKQGPRRPETIRLGFLPGLDIAPLAVALDKSLFDGATIEVVPVPFARWDRLEAKLLEADLQVAITSATTPLALNLGLGGRTPWPAITPMTVSRNGNALCMARSLLAQGIRCRADLREWLLNRGQSLTLAVPELGSMAELLIRHWLAAGGIDPDRQVRFTPLSPMTMGGGLRTQQIDGFIAGRYRVAEAVEDRQGYVLATDLDIWSGHPEKVLTCSERWAEDHPGALDALGAGLMKAAERCDDGGQRPELIRILSQNQWLGRRAEIALQRQFDYGNDEKPQALLQFNRYHFDRAHIPNRAEGAWILSQFSRWGWSPFPSNRLELLGQVYRPDLCDRALAAAGYPSLRPDRHPFRLADDIPFDQDNPLDYLKALPGAPKPPVAPIPLPSLSARAPLSR